MGDVADPSTNRHRSSLVVRVSLTIVVLTLVAVGAKFGFAWWMEHRLEQRVANERAAFHERLRISSRIESRDFPYYTGPRWIQATRLEDGSTVIRVACDKILNWLPPLGRSDVAGPKWDGRGDDYYDLPPQWTIAMVDRDGDGRPDLYRYPAGDLPRRRIAEGAPFEAIPEQAAEAFRGHWDAAVGVLMAQNRLP